MRDPNRYAILLTLLLTGCAAKKPVAPVAKHEVYAGMAISRHCIHSLNLTDKTTCVVDAKGNAHCGPMELKWDCEELIHQEGK